MNYIASIATERGVVFLKDVIYRLLLCIAGINPYSMSSIVHIFSIYFLVLLSFHIKKYIFYEL